jgi:hypothetical protein
MFQLIISFTVPAVLCQTWGFYESFWVINTISCVCDDINCHIAIQILIFQYTLWYWTLSVLVNHLHAYCHLSIPSYPHYSCMVFANTTLSFHWAACLPHVDWPVMGYIGHRYPNCWIGHFCPQAWPATSPALALCYYSWVGWAHEGWSASKNCKQEELLKWIVKSADCIKEKWWTYPKNNNS